MIESPAATIQMDQPFHRTEDIVNPLNNNKVGLRRRLMNKLYLTTGHKKRQKKLEEEKETFIQRQKAKLIIESSSAFKRDFGLGCRVAIGVVLGGLSQLRNSDLPNQYLLTPSWYYLGGLSYASIQVIFAAGRNLGETIKQSWQSGIGVLIALVFNVILFNIIGLTQDGQQRITYTLDGLPYLVSETDFYTFLPFITVYSFLILLSPMEIGTKKLALALNVTFILQIINPNNRFEAAGIESDFVDLQKLDITNPDFAPLGITLNFAFYLAIGFAGSFLAIFIMLFPTPIIAIAQFRKDSLHIQHEVDELLNLIIDAYSTTNKSDAQLAFLFVKLDRLFDESETKYNRMEKLTGDIWWEKIFCLDKFFNHDHAIMAQYVTLYRTLVQILKSINQSMQDSTSSKNSIAHAESMKILTPTIYGVQRAASFLLSEISEQIHAAKKIIEVDENLLKVASEKLLKAHHEALVNLYRQEVRPGAHLIPYSMSFNLFVFNIVSFNEELVQFEGVFNGKQFGDVGLSHATTSFLSTQASTFFDPAYYLSWKNLKQAIKITVAITLGCFPAVYIYGYSASTPAVIAVVLGGQIGGSFKTTTNRVIGIVAGSVIPSMFNFFICAVSNTAIQAVLKYLILFIWTAMSMYVYFTNSFVSYIGIVSSFVAAGVFLDNTCIDENASADEVQASSVASFASLVQTSMGVLIFLVLEFASQPEGARAQLQGGIRTFLTDVKRTYESFQGFYSPVLNPGDTVLRMSIIDTSSQKRSLAKANVAVSSTLPKLLLTIKDGIFEADLEPDLYRPAFSKDKYVSLHGALKHLRNHMHLWSSISHWQSRRGELEEVGIIANAEPKDQWVTLTNDLHQAIEDSIDGLIQLFQKEALLYTPDQAVRFLEMKEAFRAADKDGSGSIDSAEIGMMFKRILKNSPLADDELDQTVEDFINLVDKDGNGEVSLEEFVAALEHGLSVDIDADGDATVDLGKKKKNNKISSPSTTTTSAKLLKVEKLGLEIVKKNLLEQYRTWLLTDRRFERLGGEDLLAVSVFISGSVGIIQDLLHLQTIVAAE